MNTIRRDKYEFIDAELSRRKNLNQLRKLRNVKPSMGVDVFIDGRRMLNFCSNDYLGLSKHPYLQERSIDYIKRYGSGSTAARLICGNYEFYKIVEQKLAHLKQVEASLIFSSGFQANISILPTIADRNSLIFSDQLNHNSLILGARLAGCTVKVYRHNDMHHLRQLLEENKNGKYSRVLIVSESVFSMDGDICDMDALEDLADEFNAFLFIDDAHATGIFGQRGMGLTCGRKVDLVMGTFGKSGGSFGAYLACSEKIRDYMINCCSGFIYTTAIPPSVIGAMDAALDLIPQMDKERESILNNAEYLRNSLKAMGWDTAGSVTHIIPVIIGKESDALSISRWLEENGILITAIRPPTVPAGLSRIRISLSALHTRSHIDHLIDAMWRWKLKSDDNSCGIIRECSLSRNG
jgi:8-amino-7-oxononanoate synthase